MREIDSHTSLVDLIKARSPAARVIAIDGIQGSGKSTLSKTIIPSLGGTLVSLDGFLKQNQGTFLQSLRLPEVRSAVQGSRFPLVVEGICVLAALKAVDTNPDLHVYVKQLDSRGDWSDRDVGDPSETAEEIIRSKLAFARQIAQALGDTPPSSLGLLEEVIRYHCDFRPLAVADVAYVYKLGE